jgi:hypothetical protein
MIEPIMYIAIGFLVAGLLVIGVIPMVHARAVRLTQRRLEAITPMSMAEIHADKDQLRAEFAMATRRLEISVEQMKAKTTSQLAEIGKKSDAIGRLKIELGEKAAELLAAEAKINAMEEELHGTQRDLTTRSEALRESERKLEERGSELARNSARLNESSLNSDSQRIEIVALQAQHDVLKGRIESYENEVRDLEARLSTQTEAAETANALLAEERIKTDAFAGRIKGFEKQLIEQTTEAEILSRRVPELLARLDEHERMAAEREFAAEELRGQAAAAQQGESELRGELSARDTRHRVSLETLSAEKARLDERLREALAEREQLQRELAAVRQDAENAGAAERMEAAVLRERINDVAAEVARLTAAIEGPSSPIDAILAADTGRPHAGANGGDDKRDGAPAGNGGETKGSLADRIRALQSRRARVSRAG